MRLFEGGRLSLHFGCVCHFVHVGNVFRRHFMRLCGCVSFVQMQVIVLQRIGLGLLTDLLCGRTI